MKPRQPITMRKVFTYATVLFLAFGNAMSYHIFVFPKIGRASCRERV